MSKRENPLHWMPLSVDLWLGELAGGLRADQKGALIDLLALSWQQQPPCTLPNDDIFLAARSGLGAKWKANRAVVLARFTETDDGRLLCGWLRVVYDEQLTKYLNRSTANRANRRGTKDTTNEGTNGVTNRAAIGGTNGRQSKEEPLPLQGKKAPANGDALALEAPRSAVADADDEHRERERLARIHRRPGDEPGPSRQSLSPIRDIIDAANAAMVGGR